jgi:histidinol-phosphate aminotransferase
MSDRYVSQPTRDDIARIAGIAPEDVIRFDHNTSPFHPEWAPPIAATAARWLNEYPGADYLALRTAAARFSGVDVGNVVAGAGIDELIIMSCQAFLEPGGRVAAVTPTYPLHRVASHNRRARLTEIDLHGPDFEPDPDRILDAARDADLLWLTVPANPVGNRMPDDLIAAAVAATDGVVVVDAAYAEIAGDEWGGWVLGNHNLVVLRSLSKAFNLAGARVGYAMAHPSLIDRLDAVRPPGSISGVSAALGEVALGDLDGVRRTVAAIVGYRDRLAADLSALGWRVLPSHTNFLLCEVGADSLAVARRTLEKGMIVRSYPDDGPLGGYLRITVRSPEENSRLLEALTA